MTATSPQHTNTSKNTDETRQPNVGYRFGPENYAPMAGETTSAAKKLSDSAVAPIVAVSRGYWSVSDVGDFDEFARTAELDKRRGLIRAARQQASDGTDGLAMPWYSVTALTQGSDAGGWQYRPGTPPTIKGEQGPKYFTGKGARLPLDVHPATPVDWLSTAPTILFAEGLLKGDAALSAYLAAQGAGEDMLARTDSASRRDLREFLETIPASQQVLIVRPSSVTTFHSEPGFYAAVDVRDRDCLIGIDGDVATNPKVWDQAKKVVKRLDDSHAKTISLLSPTSGGEKDGIDDFLSATGDWSDLLQHRSDELPQRPSSDDEDLPDGAWRISPNKLTTQRKAVHRDPSSGAIAGETWDPTGIDFGAVISSFIVRRTPTKAEMASGELDPAVYSDRDEVELRFTWSESGVEQSAIVTVPASVFDLNMEQWGTKGASIPGNLRVHPSWPPRGTDSSSFLEAVKRASAEHPNRVHWRRNGWVPVQNSTPAFILGETTLAADPGAVAATHSDVDSRAISSYESYGIGGDLDTLVTWPEKKKSGKIPTLGEWDFEKTKDQVISTFHPNDDKGPTAKREQIVEDTQRLRELFFDSGAWTDQAVPALVLATALRPLVPTPERWPRAPLYIYGGKGQGKTWTAEVLMSFWASAAVGYRGFASGQAQATPTDLEVSCGTMPIWLADDLPPATSVQKAQRDEQGIVNIVRSAFNGNPRGGRKPDLSARETVPPYAQVVITAENELSVPSAWDRVNSIYLAPGALHPDREVTDVITEAAIADGLFARITHHFAEWMVQKISNKGWDRMVGGIRNILDDQEKRAADLMVESGMGKASVKRSAELAAEMLVVIKLFGSFLGDAGKIWPNLTVPYNEILEDGTIVRDRKDDPKESSRHPRELSELAEAVCDHIAANRAETEAQKPGRLLLDALAAALRAGDGHLVDAEDPESPPITEDIAESLGMGSANMLNHDLGWRSTGAGGALRGPGTSIGKIAYRDGAPVVFFDGDNSFPTAQKAAPHLLKSGMQQGATWKALFAEGYAVREIAEKKKGESYLTRRLSITKKDGSGERVHVDGKPVMLATVLNPDESDDGD